MRESVLMKSSRAWSSSGIRYALALGLGILQAASFPKIDLAPLAWLVPGGLMFLAMDRPGLNAFRIGYYAGLSHYLISLYWLLLIPLPIHAFAAWLSVSAVLALYPGAWTCFCSWILLSVEKQGPASRPTRARSSDKPAGVAPAAKEWPQFFWPLICACGWVAMEMGIARILTGFPWDLLGA